MFIIPLESWLFDLRYVYTVGRQKPSLLRLIMTASVEFGGFDFLIFFSFFFFGKVVE